VRAFGVDVAMNRWQNSVIGAIKTNGPNVIIISLLPITHVLASRNARSK